MTTLHHTIEIMGYEGSVLSVHYKLPGLSMENVNESDGNSDAVDDNVNEYDEDKDWFDDVEYAPEHENDELNEYLAKARGYVDEIATFGNTKRNVGGEIVDDDSDGDYSVGNDDDNDPDLNWSLADGDEDELCKELAKLENEEVEVEALKWLKSKNIYFNHDRPQLKLNMLFKDRQEFKETLIKDSIEKCHPFNYKKNDKVRVNAKCVNNIVKDDNKY
ncbi:hypothetical protein ACFE04_026422 [Oxalis oulophora]